jgi:hypothetical protein
LCEHAILGLTAFGYRQHPADAAALKAEVIKGVIMDHSDRCRTQADECHRLMLLSQSGAEATILTSLTRSWKMIANQTDRYVAIMRRQDAARK